MRLIPPTIPASAPPGEKKIFKKFSYDKRFNNWIALHSLEVAKHHSRITGELDFIIINPSYGILCAEIKSHHKIVCKDRQWYFGNSDVPEISPFKQVKETSFSLRNYLIKKKEEFRNIPWWHIVIFPRCKFIYDSPSWQPWEVIDRDGCKNLYRSLTNSFQYARQHLIERTKTEKDYKLTDKRIELILDYLRPEFEVLDSSKSPAEERDNQIRKFTEEQFEALDQLKENERVFFKGSAGTGKTFLAIEAARRASQSGQKVLLVCYNRGLCEWIRNETSDLDQVYVYNIDKLLIKLNAKNNHVGNTNDRDNHFWEYDLPNSVLSSDSLKELRNTYDQLIIDEAQDLLKPPYLDILDRLLVNGLKEGRWIIFGDFSNQSIFNTYKQNKYFITPEQFENYLETSPAKFVLSKNCRNIQQIGEFYEGYIELDPGYKTYLRSNFHGSKGAELISSKSLQQKISLTKLIIMKLQQEKIKKKIAVLSIYEDSYLSKVEAELIQSGLDVCDKINDFTFEKVFIGTVQAFKGLEADTVILRSDGDAESPEELNLFYVGCSRARDDLYVL